MSKFVIVKDALKKVRRFNLAGRSIEFKINPVPRDTEPVGWVKDAINQIIAKGTDNLYGGDMVAFSFHSKDFQRGEGWIRFKPVEQVTYEDVWNIISNVYQSNSLGLNTETFCLCITTVKMPIGKGRGQFYNSFSEECKKRRGVITIDNKDNLCLPRALVVAKANVDKDPEYRKILRDAGKMQTQRANELCRNASVSVPEEGAGIPELQIFQRYLQGYRIVVYQYGSKGRDIIFKGPPDGLKLNLLYHKGHYNVITSLTSTFCCDYYCEECHIPYNTKNKHRCGGTCPGCQQAPACPEDLKVICTDCQRSFRGQCCYNNHKKAGSLGRSTVCENIYRCAQCYKTIKRDRQHICGEIYCKICKSHTSPDHLCYIQPDHGKPKTNNILFIFYDLETRQEKMLEDGSLLHEPNLCVLSSRCDKCIDEKSLYMCQKCGFRTKIYKEDPISSFMKHVMTARQKFKQVVVIAHNGQAFDHQFVLNHILTKTDLTPELIMRGTKIISMMVENVKFIDSLNYFPMGLSKLPKAFGLGDSFKKGYFPHLFNTAGNRNYVGPLPSVENYSPDTMKEEDRKLFLSWYEDHRHDEFNMQRDIVEYCISDVEILTAACLKFRQQLIHAGNVCPFTEACTIASACNKVYRRNFLKPNTIGIIPKSGYRWRDNQSKIATQWLVWEEKQRGINIIHSAKQKEILVHGIKIDGYNSETKQIYEFHGCYFHGCPTCYKQNRDEPVYENPSETLNLRYEATTSKIDRLRNLGYEVIEMWECQFRADLKDDAIRTYTECHPLVALTPLNPRDAFYGGRTGNIRSYYKCKPSEKVKYVDVCSLYPWVCKYGKFPIGHPKIYVGEECKQININKTEGLIKCKILPPQELYHPVLPTKMNGKLMFVLCRTCGETMDDTECNHSIEDRALTGTWVIDEIAKALEKGYKLLETYEIWQYKVEQFNKASNVTGLFTAMMDKFIKIKQQASGWPYHCKTQEDRNRYIDEFFEKEDVKLDFADIVENPGLRSLAKLILNSFWGKFGQRENQPKTKIVRNSETLFSMLTNPSIYVNSVLPINEDTLVVSWEHIDEAADMLSTVNVVIASYVTTQARLKLYEYLEQLDERVLYYDTDSVIYVAREDEYDVTVGEFLGDMTDELQTYGPGSYITEFVSGGPKNYTYKVFSSGDNEEKIVCKVKGISLTYAASLMINFNAIKDMVLTPSLPIYITSKDIRRTKEHEILTKQNTKIYRPNSTKRKFFEDHSSVPHGYKKLKCS